MNENFRESIKEEFEKKKKIEKVEKCRRRQITSEHVEEAKPRWMKRKWIRQEIKGMIRQE